MQNNGKTRNHFAQTQEAIAAEGWLQQSAVPKIEPTHFDARDLMTIPDDAIQSIERYKATLRSYVKEYGGLPTSPQELIDYSKGTLSDNDVFTWEAYGKPYVSLDMVIRFEDRDVPLENFVVDTSTVHTHTFDYLYDALELLPEKERQLIESTFELYDDIPDSKELVSSWGMNSRQADKLLQSGLLRLAHILRPNHVERSHE